MQDLYSIKVIIVTRGISQFVADVKLPLGSNFTACRKEIFSTPLNTRKVTRDSCIHNL